LLCSVFFLVFSRPSSGFFVLFLPLFFSSFFSVLVPSLHFFFIPLDALVTAFSSNTLKYMVQIKTHT
jgi:hypothetical protein